MNAGKVARYLGRNISREGQNGFSADDLMAYTYYGMRIEVYTEGQAKASDEKVFKKPMVDCDTSAKFIAALEEFYSEAEKAELTLRDIPVGSTIKVHAKLTVGEMIDEKAYKQLLLATGMPESYIDEELEQMQENMKESQHSVEGSSKEIIVTNGPNKVTIRIKAPFDLESLDEDSFNIILYTNIHSDNDNGLWSYQMDTIGRAAAYTRNLRAFDPAEDEDAGDVIDFMVDRNGGIYYSYMYYGNELCVDYVSPYEDPNFNHRNFCYDMNISNGEESQIYVDEDETGMATQMSIFFGSCNDDGYEIAAHPIGYNDLDYTSADFQFNGSEYDYDYSDFAVQLGAEDSSYTLFDPEDPDSDKLFTYTYSDSAAYLAAIATKWQEDDDGNLLRSYDIIITKMPMTYTIEEEEAMTYSKVIFVGAPISIKLSEAGIVFPYNSRSDYPYSVRDMIIHNNKLYILLAGDQVSIYDVEAPYNYPIIANGAMIAIDLSDFTVNGVYPPIGYDESSVTAITMPQIDDDTKELVFNVSQPEAEENAGFFGPRKFVAVTSDKLVIADDGIFYYKDGNDFCYKNVDRLLVYNEVRSVLKAYDFAVEDVIKFNKHETEDINFKRAGSDKTAAVCQCNE